jgi:hypothetical protein
LFDDKDPTAVTFLQLSKAHFESCTPIVYRHVNLDECSAADFAKTVLETPDDSVETRARKSKYRQSVSTIVFGELPRIKTAEKWESSIEYLVSSDKSGPPIFPKLKQVQLSGIYVQQLALFLEVNTPHGATKPFPKFHPFTVILGYNCRDSHPRQLKISADGSLKWPESDFKGVARSRMWEVDTEINEPVRRILLPAIIHHAWLRIDKVKYTWAIDEVRRLPGDVQSYTSGLEVSLVNR